MITQVHIFRPIVTIDYIGDVNQGELYELSVTQLIDIYSQLEKMLIEKDKIEFN